VLSSAVVISAQPHEEVLEGELQEMSDGSYLVVTPTGLIGLALDPAWGEPRDYCCMHGSKSKRRKSTAA
jgi:hypothetical protein